MVTVYGYAVGFYSAPDPLTSLTADGQNWFQNFLTREGESDLSLKQFYFRIDRRAMFITGNNAYEIEQFTGYVHPADPDKSQYEFPFALQTGSGPQQLNARFFDAGTHKRIADRVTEIMHIPGTNGAHFFKREVEVPQDFSVMMVGRILDTVLCPGSLDWIVMPLQRYSGGYDGIEYTVFFDRQLDKSGLYNLTETGGGSIVLHADDLRPSKLRTDQVGKEAQKTLDSLQPYGSDAEELVGGLQSTKWKEAYRFVIPHDTVRPLTFQYIRREIEE
jgi:hypothetical protein